MEKDLYFYIVESVKECSSNICWFLGVIWRWSSRTVQSRSAQTGVVERYLRPNTFYNDGKNPSLLGVKSVNL